MKVDHYAQKNEYIRNCLENKNEGDSVESDYDSKFVCRKNKRAPLWGTSPVNYNVYKKNKRINIDISIYFNYKGNKNRDRALELARDTLPCIRNFFAKHGIKINLKIREKYVFSFLRGALGEAWDADHFINLHDEIRYADTANWSLYPLMVGYENSLEFRCGLFIHELSHRLGLNDTYPDPDCPDRKRIAPLGEIMSGVGLFGVSKSIFNPIEIKQMLAPLCGE